MSFMSFSRRRHHEDGNAPVRHSRRVGPAALARLPLVLPCVAALVLGASAQAQQQQFVFGDQALLEDAVRGLVARVIDPRSERPLEVQSPCRLHLVNDRHASDPFDQDVRQRVNAALVDAFSESVRGEDCELDVWELQAGQSLDDVQAHLRSIEENGLSLVVSYYPAPGGIMAFAKVEDNDGRMIASSGRYDLPVVPAGGQEDAPASASVASAAPPSTLRLAGSSVIGQHLAPELAEGFLKRLAAPENPDSVKTSVERDADDPGRVVVELLERPDAPLQSVEIVSRGGGAGTSALLDGEADFLMLTQQLDGNAIGAFVDAFGIDMRSPEAEHVIGIDGVEFIVNEDNRLSLLSREVIGEVLTGGIERWGRQPLRRSELDGEIRVVVSEDELGSALIDETALFGRPLMRDESAATEAEAAEMVREDPLAISYVSKDFRGVNRAVGINECGVIFEPDDASSHVEEFEINTEDHPFSRPIYLYVNPAVANPLRDEFLEYALSLEPGMGQEIVRDHFVDLGLHVSTEEATDWRYYTVGDQQAELIEKREAYRTAIRDALRLSSTFRFRNDSFGMALDSRAEADLERLVEYVRDENIPARRLLLFGFSDSVGSAEANVALARQRALSVAGRLQAAGIVIPAANVLGVGEDAPIACNSLPDGTSDLRGRYKNRRVEIWLRNQG